MRGELDWIVMKALEKDRNRRYETANGLAADLRRYLDDEPVQACPPTAAYRLSKFAKKYRVALATALRFRRRADRGVGDQSLAGGACRSGQGRGSPGLRGRDQATSRGAEST